MALRDRPDASIADLHAVRYCSSWGGKRPDQPDVARRRAGRAAPTSRSFRRRPCRNSSPRCRQQRAPVLLDLGPVVGANVAFFGEQLGCKIFIEDLFADIDRHTRARHARRAGRRARRRASRRPTAASTASSAGTSSTSSTRPRRRRWRAQIVRCCAGRRGAGVLQHRRRGRARRFTKYVIVDETNAAPPPLRRRRRRQARAAEPRHHQAVRRAARLRLVPAEEQHPRDPVPPHSATRSASLACDAPGHRAAHRLRHARPLRRHDEGRGARASVPDATLVDITHDIAAARRARRRARARRRPIATFPPARSFSPSSIPASDRRAAGIAAEAGDYRFVAPDNGVLTAVLDDTPPKRVVELTERRYARPTVSRTFEGRDRFAPAAAWLAKGYRALGARPHRDRLSAARHAASRRSTATTLRGVVLRVDRFGNLVTNIDRRTFERVRARQAGCRIVAVGDRAVARVVATYADDRRRRSRARCSAAPIISRSPPMAAARPNALGVGRGRSSRSQEL